MGYQDQTSLDQRRDFVTDSLPQRASEYQNNKRRYDMATGACYRRIQTGHGNLCKLTYFYRYLDENILVKKPVELFQFNEIAI